MRALLALILAGLWAGIAHAQIYTAHDWVTDCEAEMWTAQYGRCIGYMQAMRDIEPVFVVMSAKNLEVPFTHPDARTICLQPDVTLLQMKMVAVKYIRNNPELWHSPSQLVIRVAWAEAFPCR